MDVLWRTRSIRQNVIAWMTVFTLLVLAAGWALYATAKGRQDLHARQRATEAVAQIAQQIEGAYHAAETLARQLSAEKIDCTSFQARVVDPLHIYRNIALVDARGAVICSSAATAGGIPQSAGTIFRAFDDNRRVAVSLDLRRLLAPNVTPGLSITVTDEQRNVVARANDGNPNAVREVASREVPGPGWVVSAAIDDQAIAAGTRAEIAPSEIALLLILLANYALSIIVLRSLIRPFENVTNELRRAAAQGNGSPLPGSGPAELDELVLALNEMLTARRGIESRYHRILEAAQEGIWWIDGNLRTIFVNRYLTDLLGYSKEEMMAIAVMDVIPDEDRDAVRRQMAERRAGRSSQYEVPLLRKDGSRIWAFVSATPLMYEGEMIGSVAMISDITARREAEVQLRRREAQLTRITELAEIGGWELDLKTDRYDATNSALRILGLQSSSFDHWRATVRDLFDEESRAVAERSFQRTILSGTTFTYRGRIRRPDGQIRIVHIRADVERDASGTPSRVLGAIRDVTDEERTREEIEQQRDELRRLSDRLLLAQEEERTRIARELHDELGQMLTALKMDVDGLISGTREPRAAERLRSRILRLIDDLIDSAQRLSSDLRPSTLDLGLGPALEYEGHLFQERSGIATLVDIDKSIALSSEVSTALFRIVNEALTNVARHSGARSVAITLSREPSKAVLIVEDDGAGIPLEALQHPKSLGLTGMRERALSVGAAFEISAAPKSGTIVRVVIPIPEPVRHDPGDDRR